MMQRLHHADVARRRWMVAPMTEAKSRTKSTKPPDGQLDSELPKIMSSPKFMKIKNISLFQK
jgi:hypothetical protein